jgi:SAM-dependent methyltransferase
MKIISQCLICNSSDFGLRHPSTYTGTINEAHRYFLARRQASAHGDIWNCRSCGFVFTSPQYDDIEYDTIYSRIGSEPTDANSESLKGPGEAASRARFQRLHALVTQFTNTRAPFLDFGCGDGQFLCVADSAVATGFEVGSPSLSTGPANSRVIRGRWQAVAGSDLLPWGSQAFVTSFDVLEHLSSLERDIGLLRSVLKPSGKIFITVPDVKSLMARFSGKRWSMFLLEHLWYFDVRTLDKFMARLGFAPIHHQAVPYDAAMSHVIKRLFETLNIQKMWPLILTSNRVLAVPAGILFAAYQRND